MSPDSKLVLSKIRAEMQTDAILVSMNSSFDNCDAGLSDVELVSGFSGSNGRAVITETRAILSVDGRYVVQAQREVDTLLWEIRRYPDSTIEKIISEVLQPGGTMAISSFAHSYSAFIKFKSFAKQVGIKLEAIDTFPTLHSCKIPCESGHLMITETSYIGERTALIKQSLSANDGILLGNKETISWIFGVRKSKLDKDKGPVARAIAFFSHSGKPILFCDLDTEENEFFDRYEFEQFGTVMRSFQSTKIKAGYSSLPTFFLLSLKRNGFEIEEDAHDYASYERIKTDEEIKQQKNGALETASSFIVALAHIENDVLSGCMLTEKDAISYLKNEKAIDYSFNPICASGPNTSVVHYNANSIHNRGICSEEILLLDAGFHFAGSSTDMTRVIYIGSHPSEELRRIYTIVLKSLIFYSICRFPKNISAQCLDAICRYHMWQNNLDYSFGTGHGVGSYRSVHEAPHISRYSKDSISDRMITTIEPGYYTSEYGIRLENMLLSVADHENDTIFFETITQVPFDLRLVNKELLGETETSWLNDYHQKIRQRFSQTFESDPVTLLWLARHTTPI